MLPETLHRCTDRPTEQHLSNGCPALEGTWRHPPCRTWDSGAGNGSSSRVSKIPRRRAAFGLRSCLTDHAVYEALSGSRSVFLDCSSPGPAARHPHDTRSRNTSEQPIYPPELLPTPSIARRTFSHVVATSQDVHPSERTRDVPRDAPLMETDNTLREIGSRPRHVRVALQLLTDVVGRIPSCRTPSSGPRHCVSTPSRRFSTQVNR
jgi:hypothetical protein